MPDFLTEGYKTIYCKNGHLVTIPIDSTGMICPTCGEIIFIIYNGTVAGEFY